MEPFVSAMTPASADRSAFVNKVFLFFALALLMSAAGSYGGFALFSVNPSILTNPFVMFGSFAVTLVLVFTTHMWQERSPLNYLLFTLFTLLMGFSLAPLLLLVGMTAGIGLIFKAFFSATCVFAAAAVFGSVTKKDLSSWGGMLMVSVIALIVVGMVNIFLGSQLLEMILSSVAILIFTGFTAYDMQMIKQHYPDSMYIAAAMGLFINFIGLFRNILYLLWSFSQD
ncbi:hypothetical protein COW46_00055 [Candidatus Gracilibacteria bacterium CG17_big_fil_post_rev_8_21_14_2_50_48_13]|nr:MAG: hypothetical protein COW46_00055 [Candidatus Gracilibacteria bacterium CG17_big_fil_post_rev_8_21_14_2_50_48_13]